MTESSKPPLALRDQFAKGCGEIALGAALAAALWAVPVTLRVSLHQQVSMLSCWLALVTIALPPLLFILVLMRGAQKGFRSWLPEAADRNVYLSAAGLWALLGSVGLSIFGRLLSAGTHHRGLGGTTYAILGVGLVLGAALVSVRLSQLLKRLTRYGLVAWASVALASLMGAYLLWNAVQRAIKAQTASAPLWAVVDVAVLFALAFLASRLRLPMRGLKVSVPIGLGLVVVLSVAGLTRLHHVALHSPPVGQNVLVVEPLLDLLAAPDTTPRSVGTLAAKSPEDAPSAAPPEASASAPAAVSASASASAAAAASQPSVLGKAPSKPDLLLVTLDTVRADHLGAYGYSRATSPTFDKLAAQGVLFEQVYAAGPETRTAITPLVTGKYLHQSARDDRPWPTLLDDNQTLAERLQSSGYSTGAVSSFLWLSKDRGFAQGFDEFDESPFRRIPTERDSSSSLAIDQAIRLYDTLSQKGNPVFLWVHLFDAHGDYIDQASHHFGTSPLDHYDSEIAFQDEQLARLVDHVQKAGRQDRTVWMVHGSGGEAFGEHGFWGHPGKLFQEVLKVPLVVLGPGFSPRKVKEPVSTVDLAPTMLAFAGASSADLPGRPLSQVLSDAAQDKSAGILVALSGLSGTEPGWAWIEGNYKLVVHQNVESGRAQLFDWTKDPEEKSDLFASQSQDALRLRGNLTSALSQKAPEVSAAKATGGGPGRR